jgi:hypothetical protein
MIVLIVLVSIVLISTPVERIYDYLANQEAPVAIDAIVAEFELTSTQKASALLKKLVDDGRVVKVKEGKKVAYQVAND